MSTFKFRYRLKPDDTPKRGAVHARNWGEAYSLAFQAIDARHCLSSYAEREAVELDDGQNPSDPFAPVFPKESVA
jgi:hypothetical protein